MGERGGGERWGRGISEYTSVIASVGRGGGRGTRG